MAPPNSAQTSQKWGDGEEKADSVDNLLVTALGDCDVTEDSVEDLLAALLNVPEFSAVALNDITVVDDGVFEQIFTPLLQQPHTPLHA